MTAVLALAVAASAAVPARAADASAGRWGVGLEGGVMKLDEGDWDYSAADRFGRLRLTRGLSPQWNLQLAWLRGHSAPGVEVRAQEAGWTFTPQGTVRTLLSQPMLELEHRLSPGAVVSPTLTAAIGVTHWRVIEPAADSGNWFPTGDTVSGRDINGQPADLSATNPTIGVGLGLDVAVTGSLHLGMGARYQVLQGNRLDNAGLSALWGPDHVDANTALVSGWAGMTWWFGSPDRDGDGVPDNRDACPDEREDRDGYNDHDGCPDLDNDGDGIPDSVDTCPRLAEDFDGFEDADGCPDLDNDRDGIPDGRDRCPDEAEDINGFEDADGCPDSGGGK